MEFKEKFKSLRKEKNITQEKIASDIFVSRSVVAKWENGLVLPKDDIVEKLARYFHVEPEFLISEKDREEMANHGKKKDNLKPKYGFILSCSIMLAFSSALMAAGVTSLVKAESSSKNLIEGLSVTIKEADTQKEIELYNRNQISINKNKYYLLNFNYDIKNNKYNIFPTFDELTLDYPIDELRIEEKENEIQYASYIMIANVDVNQIVLTYSSVHNFSSAELVLNLM